MNETNWTTIDVANEDTWPPFGKLVVFRAGSSVGLRCIHPNEESDGFDVYDEDNDYDDGALGWEVASGETVAEWSEIQA